MWPLSHVVFVVGFSEMKGVEIDTQDMYMVNKHRK
jgi:hypothetical protein